MPALERFSRTLPYRVHATNDFSRGAYRERVETARTMAEIAPDPPGWITALRFDVDREGAGAAWLDAELPPPNIIVTNPRTGHAHLIYLLGGWVRTDFAEARGQRVVRYAAAIERAYAAALGADLRYAGRFHHNPLSSEYSTKVGREEPYSLAELAQYVDLSMPEKKQPTVGIGRNVEIFDRLRRWAYAAVADWRIGGYDAWHGVALRRAEQIAADIGAESARGPLQANEIVHIAKSVARWVWEKYRALPPLLQAEKAAQRRERDRLRKAARRAAKRTREEYVAPARDRRERAAEMRALGMPVRQIAESLAVSVREIYRLLTKVLTPVLRRAPKPLQDVAQAVHGSSPPSDFGGEGLPPRSSCGELSNVRRGSAFDSTFLSLATLRVRSTSGIMRGRGS